MDLIEMSKSKKLSKVGFHLVEDIEVDGWIVKDCCNNCMHELYGRCSAYKVKVPTNGKCDSYD